jgi:hypothetical protein
LGGVGAFPTIPGGSFRPGPSLVTVSPPIASRTALVVLVWAACLAGGCASLGKPEWLEPGPARNQQRRAVRFDPFLENDIGPYAFRQYGIMDGSRPRDYAEPVAEVRRARWWSTPARR